MENNKSIKRPRYPTKIISVYKNMDAEFINKLSNNFTIIKITVHQRVSLKIVDDIDFG